ncbi:hypothetical protein J2X85_000010 [Microbacterium trichothecenolyticum]|uniref:hypothetical protein n=1 Tax=Microbacterium trichothecenolyticum TaxID=69370 RepID=UPI0028593F18|nr:hypothetical protein [Microbacterium trichothecenolyticum]MDR7182987.1 hypothetical protein [Microbacterium trichothecenolyticum]
MSPPRSAGRGIRSRSRSGRSLSLWKHTIAWRHSRITRATAAGLVTGLLTASLLGAAGAVVDAEPAAAADDGLTSSAVTVTNKEDAIAPDDAPFPDLEVTVSQTSDLVSQGIRVSWKGGKPSERPSSTVGGTNFLQIAQCWGEDPDNPGHPDRRTCVYGGTLGAGTYRDGSTDAEDVADEDLAYTHFSESFFSPTYTGIPFVAANSAGEVDETKAPADRVLNNLTTNAQGDVVQKTGDAYVDLNTNQFFTAYTTNEVKWAGTGADGTGSVPFEVQTTTQSTALGCGSPIEQSGGSVVGQSCWLVIIPRGQGDSGSNEINRSGLWWDAWEHHLAVKLDFKPVGVRCEIGEAERQLAGSELISEAMGSWQPELCKGDNGSPFVLSDGREADALVKAAGTDPSPLAFTSRPLDMNRVAADADPVAYAPVALSGIAISFSIDRQPHPQNASAEERAREGLPMTELKLTPRLVAKLLTASYVDALPDNADKSHIGYKSFTDPGKNPRTIVQDKEFQAINDPEWSKQIIVGASVADALAPTGRSDLAVRLWEYVLADRAARAWLNGEPDENGMIVNPWYSTNSEVNPNGVPLALPTDGFPKADPIEKPDQTVSNPSNGTGAVNLVTWRPFTRSFADSAYRVLRGDGLVLGEWDKIAKPPKFQTQPRQLFGSQKVIGLTTAPSSELYQTATAALRNPAGEYVAPTRDSIAAGAAAMTPNPQQPKILEFSYTGAAAQTAPAAYPLTMPVYAALNPRQTDIEERAAYADLIRYAVQHGQAPGTDVGQLPPGYAPIPAAWVTQALAAADAIEKGSLPPSLSGTTNGAAGPGSPIGGTTQSGGAGGLTQPSGASASATEPVASGAAAGELTGAATAADPESGPLVAAVPLGIVIGLAAAMAVLIVSRVGRRA